TLAERDRRHDLPIDAGDADVRPRTTRRARDRPADQPKSGDADRAKRRLTHLLQPRRATDSTQILLPIAGAMTRSSAMSRSNCAGNIDCAPSERAWSGSQ